MDPRQDGRARGDGARRDAPARARGRRSSSGSTSRARSTRASSSGCSASRSRSRATSRFDEETRRRCADEVQAALGDLRAAIATPARALRAATERRRSPRRSQRLRHEYPDLGLAIERDSERVEAPAPLEPLAQSVLAEAIRNAHKHAQATRVDVRTEIARRDLRARGHQRRRRRPDGPQTGMGLRLAGLRGAPGGRPARVRRARRDRWQVRLVVPFEERMSERRRSSSRRRATREAARADRRRPRRRALGLSPDARQPAVGRALPQRAHRAPRPTRSRRATSRTSRSSTCSSARSPEPRSASSCASARPATNVLLISGAGRISAGGGEGGRRLRLHPQGLGRGRYRAARCAWSGSA